VAGTRARAAHLAPAARSRGTGAGGGRALIALQAPSPPRLATLLPSIVLWLVVTVLLDLEQRWAENVNLAFFKINVWVGCGVLALVLVTRALNGGFGWPAT